MIFSNSTRDIYWILSKLLKNFDISILKRIINEKNRLENKENYDWHIEQGLLLNKLRIKDHKDLFIRKILFNYSKESYQDLNNYHIRVFHNIPDRHGIITNSHGIDAGLDPLEV